jgi:chromate reductase
MPTPALAVPEVLAISGSLRARSSNTELLRALGLVAPTMVRVTLYEGLAAVPPFNPDLDDEGAVPPPVVHALRTRVAAADAVVICSPEYAHGVAGALKNALDWLVSFPALADKPVALLNASARSTIAHAALSETLRTMSTGWLPDASVTVPLDGRRLDAAQIAADPALARILRDVLARIEAAARPRAAAAER